ncbi:hypothetical protein HK405_005049 [Cladochytrium tenue]|nr:hypothetical protein HK405_005049 [Cladochytrium tenue]
MCLLSCDVDAATTLLLRALSASRHYLILGDPRGTAAAGRIQAHASQAETQKVKVARAKVANSATQVVMPTTSSAVQTSRGSDDCEVKSVATQTDGIGNVTIPVLMNSVGIQVKYEDAAMTDLKKRTESLRYENDALKRLLRAAEARIESLRIATSLGDDNISDRLPRTPSSAGASSIASGGSTCVGVAGYSKATGLPMHVLGPKREEIQCRSEAVSGAQLSSKAPPAHFTAAPSIDGGPPGLPHQISTTHRPPPGRQQYQVLAAAQAPLVSGPPPGLELRMSIGRQSEVVFSHAMPCLGVVPPGFQQRQIQIHPAAVPEACGAPPRFQRPAPIVHGPSTGHQHQHVVAAPALPVTSCLPPGLQQQIITSPVTEHLAQYLPLGFQNSPVTAIPSLPSLLRGPQRRFSRTGLLSTGTWVSDRRSSERYSVRPPARTPPPPAGISVQAPVRVSPLGAFFDPPPDLTRRDDTTSAGTHAQRTESQGAPGLVRKLPSLADDRDFVLDLQNTLNETDVNVHPILSRLAFEGLKLPLEVTSRFQPLGYLGCGANGFVIRALRIADNKQVAIKFSKHSASREPAVLSSIKWLPFVQRLVHVWSTTAMGFGNLPPLRAMQVIVAQLALSFSQLHRCGVFHGDIKGNNIVIDRNYEIRIIDFGAAICVQPGLNPRLRRVDFAGTLAYAAPEAMEESFCAGPADLW